MPGPPIRTPWFSLPDASVSVRIRLWVCPLRWLEFFSQFLYLIFADTQDLCCFEICFPFTSQLIDESFSGSNAALVIILPTVVIIHYLHCAVLRRGLKICWSRNATRPNSDETQQNSQELQDTKRKNSFIELTCLQYVEGAFAPICQTLLMHRVRFYILNFFRDLLENLSKPLLPNSLIVRMPCNVRRFRA